MASTSPPIGAHGWGRITVAGETHKDVVVWPGGARGWDWNETGTDHGGGIRAAAVADLLARGAEHVVLSRGRAGRLAVHGDALALLDDRGVPHDVLATDDAIDRYAQLRADGVAVGALIHTTC